LKSIRTRLIIVFSLVITMLLGVVGIVTITRVNNKLMEEAYSELELLAEAQAMHVAARRDEELRYVNALAQNTIITDARIPFEEKAAYFEAEATRTGYEGFVYVNTQGVGTNFDRTGSTVDVSDRDYFLGALNGEPTASDVIISRVTGEPVMIFASPVYQEDRIVGVLYGRRDGTVLSQISSDIQFKGTGYGYVANELGVIIGHGDINLVLTQFNPIAEATTNEELQGLAGVIERAISRREIGHGIYYFEGEDRMVGFAPVEGSPWTVVTGVEAREVLQEVSNMRNLLIMFIFLAVLIGGVVVFIVSGNISKPIHAVNKIVGRLSEGDLRHYKDDQALKYKDRKDEIGSMVREILTYQENFRTHALGALDKISAGDLSVEIPVMNEKDQIGPVLNKTKDALLAMSNEAKMLIEAAVEGKLETRGDAEKFEGAYKEIVQGVNDTIDALTSPVRDTMEVLREFREGNLHVKVTNDYKGDFINLKNAINDTIATILSYVEEIDQVTGEMAKGNLDVGIEREYRGDFDGIKRSINFIINKLNEFFGDIATASDQVSNGAGQIAEGSQELSQGSTEQASSIEELTATITQIASQTRQNADNANQANKLSTGMKDHAAKGNQSMQNMLASMKDINESSKSIANIIKVIDEIAFQTNLLALNAAVEAARAGQHGKGFAVVAEEVRNLAGRSANAAKETTDLIENSIKNVEEGTGIANETAKALDDIVKGVEETSRLITEIASASNEQATGVAQINDGIEQVSEVVQNNSATAEESAAASEELASQAEMLKEMLAMFKLKDHQKNTAPQNN